eukprot:g3982.t1
MKSTTKQKCFSSLQEAASASSSISSVTDEKKVRVGDVELFTVSVSPEKITEKPVILMPGALGTAYTDFAPQLDPDTGLAKNRTVVSFDPRGYGNSRPPVRDFPLNFYQRDAEDAAGIMAAMNHEKYNVIGW